MDKKNNKRKKTMRKIRRFTRRNKRIIIRITAFIVMGIFIFTGALNKNYAKAETNSEVNKETSTADDYVKVKEDNSSEESEKNDDQDLIVGTNEEGKNYSYDAVKVWEKMKKYDYSNNGEKIVFLTFDDGSSTTVTPKILQTLNDYNVKATFFIMGKSVEEGGEEAKKLVKEEFDSGHAIGNHSYSHDYNILYPGRSLDLEAFKADYQKNADLLKGILGQNFTTRLVRCPGGYMSWKNMGELDAYLQENNMASIDWTALSKDAEGKKKDAEELLQCAIDTSKNQEMVVLLMHDTYGKEETAKSLPSIIEYFKDQGYEFKTLA